MTVSPTLITGSFGAVQVTTIAEAQSVKNDYHNRSNQLWIESTPGGGWDAFGQRNASLVLGSGGDTSFMTLDQAKLCLSTVEAGITACRGFKAQIAEIVANTSLTEDQQIAQVDAVVWVNPTVTTS